MEKEKLNYIAWMGVDIWSSLPQEVMEIIINRGHSDPIFMDWWKSELVRQQKEHESKTN